MSTWRSELLDEEALYFLRRSRKDSQGLEETVLLQVETSRKNFTDEKQRIIKIKRASS